MGGADSLLRLARVNSSDAGNYTCAVRGARSHTVSVHVLNGTVTLLQIGNSPLKITSSLQPGCLCHPLLNKQSKIFLKMLYIACIIIVFARTAPAHIHSLQRCHSKQVYAQRDGCLRNANLHIALFLRSIPMEALNDPDDPTNLDYTPHNSLLLPKIE